MKPPDGTRSQQKDVLQYELRMLVAAVALLRDQERDRSDEIFESMITEVACLHARSLIDFIVPKDKPHKDDIRLEVLYEDLISPAKIAALKAAYTTDVDYGEFKEKPCETLHKRIAHATKRRRESFDYGKALQTLLPLIAAVFDEINMLDSTDEQLVEVRRSGDDPNSIEIVPLE